jgi:hypothetical protein
MVKLTDTVLKNQAAFLLNTSSKNIYLAAVPADGDPGALHYQGQVYEFQLDYKGIVPDSLVNTGRATVTIVVKRDWLDGRATAQELCIFYGTGTPADSTLWPEQWKQVRTSLNYWEWVAKELRLRREYRERVLLDYPDMFTK